MSLPRTPTKPKSAAQPTFTDLSESIKAAQQQGAQAKQQQPTGSATKKTAMQKEGAGEVEATSMLNIEERLVMQMEHSMSMMAQTMAKMQYEFQERMLKENGTWKAEIEKMLRNSINEKSNALTSNANANVCAPNPAALATSQANQNVLDVAPPTTAIPDQNAADSRNQAATTSLLMLTPPTHTPPRTYTHTQAEYRRSQSIDRDSSDEEFHTSRRLEPRRAILRPPSRSMNGQSVHLDRWGISFDGDDDKLPVEEFVFRVEHLQQLHDLPWSIIMGDFHKLLKGKAQDWYWLHRRNHGVNSWHTFKAEMAKQFQTHHTDFDIMKQLVERKQRHNEGVEDFVHQMRKLHARLTSPMSEMELISIIKGNMSEEVAKILYPMHVKSLPDLIKEYHRVQRVFIKRRVYQPPGNHFQRPNRPVVNEIQAVDGNLEEEEDHINCEPMVEEIRRQPPKCWNCQEVGHTYMECSKARTIFCYKCGRPQTITPRCPKCNPGNANRSPTAASNSSSADQQQQQ